MMPEQSETPDIQTIPPGVKKWGKVVLEAHGCVLLENFTGRSYAYRAVDTKIGRETYICHKPKPVSESEYEGMIQKFLTSGEASGFDYCIDAKREDRVSHDKLTETLEYIFAKLLPEHGYNLRTEQMGLAKDILEILRRRMISLSEAGVGIGKTHAYLIAAAVIKRRRINYFWLRGNYPGMAYAAEMPMVIATSSIALQKAIVRDYIPEISKILMKHGVITKPFTCVIRKGKEHYVCDRKLYQLWRQSLRGSLKSLLEPVVGGKLGIDLDGMDFLDGYAKRRISVTGQCGAKCGMRNSCRYMRFIRDAQSDEYDFQVCNHNYLLADVKHRAKGQRPLIPNYQAVIIDEAHKFLPAARSMYGVELSSLVFSQTAKDIRSFIFERGQSTADLRRNTDRLDGKAGNLFRILTRNIPDTYDDEAERFKTEIDGKTAQILRDIQGIVGLLMKQLGERRIIQKYESLYYHTLRELEGIREKIAAFENHGSLIYWLEKPEGIHTINKDETLLCAIPKKLGEMLRDDLWSKGVPAVLTSGTLSAAGDFTHAKLGLGLNRLKPDLLTESSRASPFNYRDNALIYVSNSVPFPDNKDARYIESVADETERLILAAHGHTVLLFTSYRVMERVYDILKKRNVPFPLFMMGRGGVNTIERFRQSGNGVLFAAGSMWEGIDLPGDILSLLIIVKLPFAVPDPINEHEQSQFGSAEAYKNAVIIPEMLVRLKQGFGRLIRSEKDTGAVALFDYRVRIGGAYRERVFHALPDCRVTDSVGVVESFFREIKPADYFK